MFVKCFVGVYIEVLVWPVSYPLQPANRGRRRRLGSEFVIYCVVHLYTQPFSESNQLWGSGENTLWNPDVPQRQDHP